MERNDSPAAGERQPDPWALGSALKDMRGMLAAGLYGYDGERAVEAVLDLLGDVPEPDYDDDARAYLADCAVCGLPIGDGDYGMWCSVECRTEWRADVVCTGETVPERRGTWVDPDSMAAWWRTAAQVGGAL